MESSEQTELTSETETDSQMESSGQLVAAWQWRAWLGVEGLSKKEKGLMDMGNGVVIAGG